MAISLNNHESRINSINTNISSLGTRITKLENAPPSKQWEIVTYPSGGSGKTKTLTIPSHLTSYNFAVISISKTYTTAVLYVSSSPTSVNGGTNGPQKVSAGISFAKNGNTIIVSRYTSLTINFGQIQIMFYK